MSGDTFVLCLLVQYAVAMCLYGWERNWAKALYWCGALCIVLAVRWMK